ncbi:hypothetical protein IAT38_004944 [Cryptococcus sp. DSM 104549]
MSNDKEKSAFGSDEKAVVAGDQIISLVKDTQDVEDVTQAEDIIVAEGQYTEAQYNKLKWKFDLIILPVLMLCYGLQFADKISLSSGVVFGLKTDTHLTTEQYPMLTVYFYCAYLVGQIPMGWVMQRFPLGRALGCSVIVWGIVVICLGLCNNYLQLSMLRVLLGWFECAVTPGFLLIVSSWYKRSESTFRSSLFFAMNAFLGGVFNIIIYAIAKKSQENGVAGWRVIQYFLGSLTVVAGALVVVFIGIPKDVWWLTKEEKKMAHARIVGNGTGDGGNAAWDWAQVRECFRDPQYYFTILFNLSATIPNGVLTTFTALVYTGFGFTPLESILYQLPSNAIGFSMLIVSSLLVTYFPKLRFPIAIMWILVEMVVFLYIGLATEASKWQLWGSFIFSGVFAISTFMIWPIMSLNTAGRTKKTFLSGTGLIFYCAGNMIGSQTMRDAPRYLHGLTANAIVMAFEVCVFAAWWLYYVRENRRREAAFVASGMSMEEREYQNKLAGEMDVTDLQNPHFRYVC